jgi:hypothetical protein
MAKKKKKNNAVAIGLIALAIAVVIGGSMVALGVFNPTCEKARCGDPKYTGSIQNKNKDKKCKDRKCASSADKAMCCQLRGTCDSSNCGSGYELTPGAKYCGGATCNKNECCSKFQAPTPSPTPSRGSTTIDKIIAELEKGAGKAACDELRQVCAKATSWETSAGCAIGETLCSSA